MDYREFESKKVYKKSGKNFISGNKYNTVKRYKFYKKTNTHLFTFVEDDSSMKCSTCFLLDTDDYSDILLSIKAISGVDCTLSESFKHYKTYGIETLELFNDKITEAITNEEKYFYMYDHRFKTESQRYNLFTSREQVCIECGLKASFWAIQKGRNDSAKYPHLNLYGIDNDGNVVMLTKDHIIPKSKGGEDEIGNYQIMCSECNGEKGNKLLDK